MSAVDGLMVPKPPAQISAGISVPDRNSTSGTVFTSRPSRARDLVTMVEGGPTPGRVETGVGSVFRGAGTESNLNALKHSSVVECCSASTDLVIQLKHPT